GQLLFDDNEHSGVYGDVILVNGVPWPNMQVQRRKYRFRVLNASLSRSYGLQLDSGDPLTVIGTDGGLMPHPMPVSHLKIGMAERYEVVIDFSKYQIGQRVVMQNVSPKNNIDYDTTGVVMAFDVVADASDTSNNEVPFDLNPNTGTMGLTEADALRTRQFEFKRGGGQWTINGTTWDDVINSGYQKVLANPGFGDVEIWEFKNSSGGWFHPIHVHLVDFKVLDRNGRPPFDYEKGPKDTVYVGEGETVRVIMRFEHEQGRYMMHCHNLVHEDHDMMAQYLVGADTPDQDPILADRATHVPARPLRDRHDDPDEGPGGGGGGSGGGGGGGGSGSGLDSGGDTGSGASSSGSGSGSSAGSGSGEGSAPGSGSVPGSASGSAESGVSVPSVGAGPATSAGGGGGVDGGGLGLNSGSANGSASSSAKCVPKKKTAVRRKIVKKRTKRRVATKTKPVTKAKASLVKGKPRAAKCASPVTRKPVAKPKRVTKRTVKPVARRKRKLG
ncbi:MAG: multicopper oxidase domain-containing protein, partial [Mycobacteriales bacterium]